MSDDCGCCSVLATAIPSVVQNRPGLSAIAYRTGTYTSFRRAITERLAATPELAGLSSRGREDYSIAVIELWAAVADVLSFYQERMANEAYLRTATQRDSVLRKVREIGYELAPGAAATTWLAFTTERDAVSIVPAGTRVKSVPVGEEPSVTFETMDRLEARAEYNQLSVLRMFVRPPASGDDSAYFAGVGTGLAPGDQLVFVGAEKTGAPHHAGDAWDTARVVDVKPDAVGHRTRVRWAPALGHAGRPVPARDVKVFVLRQRASVFGYNAPVWQVLSDVAKAAVLGLPSPNDLTDQDRREWPDWALYAPQDPTAARTPVSAHMITILPTAQSVADAALAAAKQANQSASGGGIAAAATAVTAATQTIGQAGSTAVEIVRVVMDALGKNASASVLDFQNTLRVAADDFAAQVGNLGRFITNAVGALTNPTQAIQNLVNDLTGTSSSLDASTKVLRDQALDAAVKLLEILANTFRQLESEKQFQLPPTAPGKLSQKIADVLVQMDLSANAATNAADMAAQAAGALVADEIIRTAVKVVLDAHDPLPEPTAESVAMAAKLSGQLAVMAINRDSAVAATLSSGGVVVLSTAAIAAAAGAATVAAPAAALLLPALVPAIATALVAAYALGPSANKGARRVRDATNAAVDIALKSQYQSAPARFLARPLAFNQIDLDTVYPRLVGDSWVLLYGPSGNALHYLSDTTQTARTDYSLTAKVTRLTLDTTAVAPGALGPFAPQIARGSWNSTHNGQELLTMGDGKVLGWTATDGKWELWNYDPATSANVLPAKLASGTWTSVRSGHQLIPMADGRVLDWVETSGSWRLLKYDPTKASDVLDSSHPVVSGNWPNIVTGHQLIPMADGKVLDWVVATGDWRLWNYDPANTANILPTLSASGNWPVIRNGHRLLAMPDGRVLDWMPVTGDWWLWNYDPRNAGRILSEAPDMQGREVGFSADHRLIVMADGRVLDYVTSLNRWSLRPYAPRSRFGIRDTTVFAGAQELLLAPIPMTDAVTGPQLLVTDAVADIEAGRRLLLSGVDETGATATDLVTVVGAASNVSGTQIDIVPAIERHYRRDSLVIYGNVAYASHGETVRPEVLGDGDAAREFQRFTLRKKPLTYVPSAVPGGVTSSLRLLVDGVQWKEAATLYGAAPTEERFVTRMADDGSTTVLFGDGVSGARLPSGRQNLLALYRQGLGRDGRVGSARLTTLLDRPTGLKGVTNAAAADGDVDPETMASARETAPGTVRTFGRAVSLRDFEDRALTAGKVAKACASWVWDGGQRVIHLTVGAPDGALFSDDARDRIHATFDSVRDTNQPLRIDNYLTVDVLVNAALTVDPRYANRDVLAAARKALLSTFLFEARAFAQPVYLSDVFAILQGIDGVVGVDVNRLDLKSSDGDFRAARAVDARRNFPHGRLLMLPARAEDSTGKLLPAEIAQIKTPETDVVLTADGGRED